MRKVCGLCGKGTVISRNRSHAQNRTPRAYKANIQRVTIKVREGEVSGDFCAKCIKRVRLDMGVNQKPRPVAGV